MNLSGITGGITKNAGKLGALATLFVANNGNNVDAIISSVQNLMAGVVHAPDMQQIQWWLQNEGKQAALAYIAGLLVDDFKVPIIGKYGKALQNGAVGYGGAALAIRAFYGMTHSELKGVNIEKDSVMENFKNAPMMAALTY